MAVDDGNGPRTLVFRTNVDDVVRCGPAHPLRFETGASGGLKPYLHVRRDLWARLTRPLFYDLVALGEERPVDGRDDVRHRVGRRLLRHGAGLRDRGADVIRSLADRPETVCRPPKNPLQIRDSSARSFLESPRDHPETV